MRGLRIIALAKQVPDTRNVGKDAMTEEGTVNRAVLPAIFNPDDLHALEQGLRIKEQIQGSSLVLLTMGPARAIEIIKQGLYRGIDKGYVITDMKFAGSDTLATSYALSMAVRKLGNFDLIISGRQAIDGDTAQVGPQIAEKLGIPQITYAENIKIKDNYVIVKRRLERGYEIVKAPLPVLITVHSSAPVCRPQNARLALKYKYANYEEKIDNPILKKRDYLKIKKITANDLGLDTSLIGLNGSPTKVKKIESITFSTKETTFITELDSGINELMKNLIQNHTID